MFFFSAAALRSRHCYHLLPATKEPKNGRVRACSRQRFEVPRRSRAESFELANPLKWHFPITGIMLLCDSGLRMIMTTEIQLSNYLIRRRWCAPHQPHRGACCIPLTLLGPCPCPDLDCLWRGDKECAARHESEEPQPDECSCQAQQCTAPEACEVLAAYLLSIRHGRQLLSWKSTEPRQVHNYASLSALDSASTSSGM